MTTTVIDILTLFQLFLLAVTLILTQKGRTYSNRLLAGFLFIQSQCVISGVQWRYFQGFVGHIPYLFFWPVSILMLLGAGLYLFTRSMCEPDFQFSKKDWLHTLPFFLHSGFYTIRFHQFGTTVKKELLISGSYQSALEGRLLENSFFLLMYIYAVAIIIQLIRYKKRIHQVSASQKAGLQWLFIITLGFIFVWTTDVMEYYLYWIRGQHTWMVYLPHPAVFILTTIMVWKTMMQSNAFEEFRFLENQSQRILTKEQMSSYANRLNEVMKIMKPYLDPELTLSRLSEVADIPPRHLSLVLNEYFQQNFYDYINHHRIQASKELMQDEDKSRWTILQILYEAGFNSKTTFNIAFKKQTGMTPKSYRQQKQHESIGSSARR